MPPFWRNTPSSGLKMVDANVSEKRTVSVFRVEDRDSTFLVCTKKNIIDIIVCFTKGPEEHFQP
jgi:hypothetical protein